MKKLYLLIACLVFAAVTVGATKDVVIPFKQFKLMNGLTVILSEDHTAPTLALVICYKVGSRDEAPGRTGFAHFFEHLMTEGSENMVHGEIGALVHRFGGVNSGDTTQDRTLYYATLPANQLELGLFSDSDRMRSLALTQEHVDYEREIVKEERRLTVDNRTYGKSNEVVLQMAYVSGPYNHIVLGSMDDINAARLEDFQAFFKRYYAPNNAVVVIVGDFKSEEALAKTKKYYGDIPAQPAPPRPDITEPQQNAERRITVGDDFAQSPRIQIVYKIPPGDTADYYSLKVASGILNSRFAEWEDRHPEMGVRPFATAGKRSGPGLEQISATPHSGKDLGAIEQLIYSEIARLKSQLVEKGELEEIRMSARRSQMTSAMSQGNLGRATTLAESAVVFGDPNLVNTESRKETKVTREDVMRVAKNYFTEINRTVVITLPKPQAPVQVR